LLPSRGIDPSKNQSSSIRKKKKERKKSPPIKIEIKTQFIYLFFME
jgi:hypothetical protein